MGRVHNYICVHTICLHRKGLRGSITYVEDVSPDLSMV